MKGIRNFLKEHAAVNPASFHMPGHKGAAFYRDNGYGEFLDMIMDMDITEIPGADNLFQTEGIIRDAMDKYTDLYEVKQSYLLVNGSSGGLIASILASVNKGGKLLMARNSHKSIFNALSLGDIDPVYIYPETIEEYGISGEINPDTVAEMLDADSEIQAVILPSPNYYGICSDVTAIAEECHKRGKILIIDQAHGAHLKFFHKFGGEIGKTYPKAAEDCGADLVINSVHKTLGSWTQSALLNLCSDRVNQLILEDKLQVIESSSPSYPLMTTLEINADMLMEKGEELIGNWIRGLEDFYKGASEIKGLKVMSHPKLDRTKLNVDMSAYGLNGNELEEELMKDGVFIELVTGNIVMGMSGIGNTKEHFDRFLAGLEKLAANREFKPHEAKEQPESITKILERKPIPSVKEVVNLDDAEGRICASSVIPYPPGIPIICPGEVYDRELIEYIKERRLNNEKVIGLSAENTVIVGR